MGNDRGDEYAKDVDRAWSRSPKLALIHLGELNLPFEHEPFGGLSWAGPALPKGGQPVWLRATVTRVGADAQVQFAYSFDGDSFSPIGAPFMASVDRWIGAKVGVIATAASAATATGHADFDWVRVQPVLEH